MPDDEQTRNAFVRWKQHVDASVSSALNGVLGVPTLLSKNLQLHRRDGPNAGKDDFKLFRYLWQPDPVLETRPRLGSFDERMAWQRKHLGYDPAVNEFADFLQNSPYSPLNLRHLPQPVPNDCPPNVDPHGFTFSDAFVDLMCSTMSAQTQHREELVPLDAVLSMNIRRHQTLGYMDPTWPSWVMYYRVGMFDSFLREPNPVGWLEGTNTDMMVRGHQEQEHGSVRDWMTQAAEAYRMDESNDAVARPEKPASSGSLFDELDHAFRTLKRVIEEETGHGTPESDTREADTEDELYKAVKSAFAEPGKSLGTLIKTIPGGNISCEVNGEGEFSSQRRTSVPKTGEDEQSVGELRKVTEREEHVDFLGYRHVKTVTRTLNANGEEVARETHYTVRSQPPPRSENEGPKDQTEDDDYPWDDEDDEDQPPHSRQDDRPERRPERKKPGGWFWK